MRALVLLLLTGCGFGTTPLMSPSSLVPNVSSKTMALAIAINTADPPEFMDVQLSIVREAALRGQVIVFTSSDDARVALEQRLSTELSLSGPLSAGTLCVLTARFEGAWIRDYGPLIATNGFVDAIYSAIRSNYFEQQRAWLYDKIQTALIDSKTDRSIELDKILKKIEAFDKLIGSRSRPLDDDAPFSILNAVYTTQRFDFQQVNIELDGGNLLRLASGACLTTTDTIDKNHGHRTQIEGDLRHVGLCRQVIFLRPLPGQGIIKHVDMFALPAIGENKVFLADYSDTIKRMHVKDEDDDSTMLASLNTDALLAMNHNADLLAASGIVVIRIPALGATMSERGIYFPTTLNGVYAGTAEHQTLLLPKYDRASREIQDAGISILRRELKNIQIIEIETTASAILQGAIHCLTIELPLTTDSANDAERFRRLQSIYQKRAIHQQAKADEQFHKLHGKWDDLDNTGVETGIEVTDSELIFTRPGDSFKLRIERVGLLLTKQPYLVRIINVSERYAMLEINGRTRRFYRHAVNNNT